MNREEILRKIQQALTEDNKVCFAYFYGSCARGPDFRDIDIAVYTRSAVDPLSFAAETKERLAMETGLPADLFDVRVINGLLERGDLFTLLYLREILENGTLCVDKDFDRRAGFIEQFGSRFRENAGLFREVLL